jgi:hypothetical protein
MAEDLGEEDVVGNVFGFELVATDGAVGRAQVAWFQGLVQGAEGGGVRRLKASYTPATVKHVLYLKSNRLQGGANWCRRPARE